MRALIAASFLLALACAHPGKVRTGSESMAAPEDHAVHAADENTATDLFRAMQPAIEQARTTYPNARRRFLEGLPEGAAFYLTTRLRDERGKVEQVFITVESIDAGGITGRIANAISTVSGYVEGQTHVFSESEVLDWTIVHSDGREEGNYIGKFLDKQRDVEH